MLGKSSQLCIKDLKANKQDQTRGTASCQARCQLSGLCSNAIQVSCVCADGYEEHVLTARATYTLTASPVYTGAGCTCVKVSPEQACPAVAYMAAPLFNVSNERMLQCIDISTHA